MGYSNIPEWNYALKIGFEWKGIDVEALFHGVANRDIYLSGPLAYSFTDNGSASKLAHDSWTPENPNAELPMLAPRDYRSYAWTDVNYYWKKANYIRLSNLNIGYTFDFAQPLGNAISSIKVFATGTNLFYISGFKHWDPELNPGWSGVGYPVMRTLGGGISVNF